MSTKISDFVGITSVDDDGLLTVVQNGQNFKITQAQYLAQFGVTGTLVQAGAVTGTPILDTQGTVNNIRNLEDGPGILASVSPENGATIAHNFNAGAGGVAVLTDLTEASPTVRQLVAGAGMNLSVAPSGAILIAFTGSTPVTNTVVVNDVTDLPIPSANVITLETGIVYIFEALVDIGANRILFSTGNAFLSLDRVGRGIVSDNPGACITVTGTNNVPMISSMLVNSTAGSAFDVKESAGLILNNTLTTQSAAPSTFENTSVVSLRNYSIVDAGSGVFGMLWVGTCEELNGDTGFLRDWEGVLFDFGTAVFTNGMTLAVGMRMNAKSGSTIMSGLPNSGNIAAGAIGLVAENKFLGAGTFLTGIETTDARWDFHKNTGINETRSDAILTMHGNTTATAIALVNTPVLVAGTWVVDSVSQMTGTTSGRATFDSEQGERLPLSSFLRATMASGAAKTVTAYIAINGQFQANSGIPVTVNSGTVGSTLIAEWDALLTTGDFVEVYIANISDDIDIVVTDIILRIH